MADKLTPEARSANMRRVRGRDTQPELRVRKLLHSVGYRFRLHRRDLPGTPDLYLPKHKLAVFVHGCFWHGHGGCRRARLPGTRQEFWASKIATNQKRDASVLAELTEAGIGVVTLWECELKDDSVILARIERAAKQS